MIIPLDAHPDPEAIAHVNVSQDKTKGVVYFDMTLADMTHRWIALKPEDALRFAAVVTENALALDPAALGRLNPAADAMLRSGARH